MTSTSLALKTNRLKSPLSMAKGPKINAKKPLDQANYLFYYSNAKKNMKSFNDRRPMTYGTINSSFRFASAVS
ncbi:MAG: hypothetical protein ACRD8W_07855 [Nitrososphaeraceae archaeon]